MAEGFDPAEFAAFKESTPPPGGPIDVSGSIASGRVTRVPEIAGGFDPREFEQFKSATPRMEDLGNVPELGNVPSTNPTAARRAVEGFQGGYGEPVIDTEAIKQKALAALPESLRNLANTGFEMGTTPLRGLDQALRLARGTAYGTAGAAAGIYQDATGANEAETNRLQRDLGILTQFPGEPGVSPTAVPTRPRVLHGEVIPPERPSAPAVAAPAQRTIEGEVVATPRENLGISLLPPETPHDLPPPAAAAPGMEARRSAGAAGTPGTGPLADVSPQTQKMLQNLMEQEGFTPHTLEQRLEEMSSHEYLGELSPNTALHMSAVNGMGGAARNEITNSVRQRAREAPERIGAAFDQAFGPNENRAQLQRVMQIERDEQSHPFWDRFRNTRVEPTPQINALLPRLEAAGALQAANRALAVEGLPSRAGFQRLGTGQYVGDTGQFHRLEPSGDLPPNYAPAVREEIPTAAAFQAAKEHLDDLIEKSLANPGGANDARRYTALKNALVTAIDNHPDPNVAGLWQQAREVYATPTQTLTAMKTGERVLTGNIHADELPFMTAAYSPAELRALRIGMRGYLEDQFGRPGRQERTVINKILAPSNQAKIRWALGDEAADRLIGAIEHEERMHNAPGGLIYNSMTQPREAASKFWQPTAGRFENISLADVAGAVAHPVRSAASAAAKLGLSKRAAAREAEFAGTRDEAARIFTLQGPERDAVARALLEGGAGPAGGTRASVPPRPPEGPAPGVGASSPTPGTAPLERKVIDPGRTGRPIKTERLPIGNEQKVLESGFERAKGPTFYSTLDNAVQSAKQEKASPEQWLGTLKNTPGVKSEEMEWLGLPGWLKAQKGPVTKQQVADYVRANNVEVREVEKGDSMYYRPVYKDTLPRRMVDFEPILERINSADDVAMAKRVNPAFRETARGYTDQQIMDAVQQAKQLPKFDEIAGRNFDTQSEALEAMRAAGADDHLQINPIEASKGTKFSSYQLPGGENYRELLLTLPEVQTPAYEPAPHPNGHGSALRAPTGEYLKDESGRVMDFMTPAGAQAALGNPALIRRGLPNFRQSHWDEPNVLAHIRFNDRTIDGKKTLFIEEIQSDWHQKGKKQGYRGESVDLTPLVERQDQLRRAAIADRERLWKEASGGRYPDRRAVLDDAPNDALEIIRKYDALERTDPAYSEAVRREGEAFSELNRARQSKDLAVPDAPFKTSWPELSLKRMIRYAAENGYDQVAWTPGKVQAERYDLSKQVDHINWLRHEDGTHDLSIYVKNQGYAPGNFTRMTDAQLADTIGKDAAERITKAEPRKIDGLREDDVGIGRLEGEGLKVGGEGMSGFYDKILPAAANKLVKKFGTKVGSANTETHQGFPGKFQLLGRGGDHIRDFDSRQEAVSWAQEHGVYNSSKIRETSAIEPKTESVHTLPITALLRRAAFTQGMPQFAHGGRVEAKNINHKPTEAQKAAGNYAKDHVHVHGLDITIENAKGKTRSGVGRDGKPWSVRMPAHYGYIKGTVGKDKDHVDVYLGPHMKSPHAYVVDQKDAETGKFDEHKILMGFPSAKVARATYIAGFSDGRGEARIGAITPTTVDNLKHWLGNGDTTKPAGMKTNDEKLAHSAVDYVYKSRVPGKHCGTCSMFITPKSGVGGACTIVKMPIARKGWCKRFEPKEKPRG